MSAKKSINKSTREKVWNKYDQHCAYCPTRIEYSKMHVDHIEAHWHNMTEEQAQKHGISKGSHEINNFNPSCARCNRWKSTFSIEQFRTEISKQVERLKRDSAAFRMALDFGLIEETNRPVVFTHEKLNK